MKIKGLALIVAVLILILTVGCGADGDEVQSSIWDEETVSACESAGIPLL